MPRLQHHRHVTGMRPGEEDGPARPRSNEALTRTTSLCQRLAGHFRGVEAGVPKAHNVIVIERLALDPLRQHARQVVISA